jgi:hypothetical protein
VTASAHPVGDTREGEIHRTEREKREVHVVAVGARPATARAPSCSCRRRSARRRSPATARWTLAWLSARRRRVGSVADGSIAAQAPFEHPSEHWNSPVHVVEDADLGLAGMAPVQATRVLHEGPLPRDRQRKQQRVQAGVVETLTDVNGRSPG